MQITRGLRAQYRARHAVWAQKKRNCRRSQMSSVNRLTSWDKELFGKELRFRFGRASGYLLSGHAQRHEICCSSRSKIFTFLTAKIGILQFQKFCGEFLIIFFDSMWRYRYANLDNFGDYSALVLALETILPQTKTGTAWAHTPFWLEFDFLNLLSLEIRFFTSYRETL